VTTTELLTTTTTTTTTTPAPRRAGVDAALQVLAPSTWRGPWSLLSSSSRERRRNVNHPEATGPSLRTANGPSSSGSVRGRLLARERPAGGFHPSLRRRPRCCSCSPSISLVAGNSTYPGTCAAAATEREQLPTTTDDDDDNGGSEDVEVEEDEEGNEEVEDVAEDYEEDDDDDDDDDEDEEEDDDIDHVDDMDAGDALEISSMRFIASGPPPLRLSEKRRVPSLEPARGHGAVIRASSTANPYCFGRACRCCALYRTCSTSTSCIPADTRDVEGESTLLERMSPLLVPPT
jgi:hypothetical protein